jgi:hemolysin III
VLTHIFSQVCWGALGGILFALGRPRLWPRVFSYHEVFHAFVVVAAVLHFAVIHHYLLPLA